MIAAGIGLDNTGIDREAFAVDPGIHATAQDLFKHMAEQIARAETAMTVLGERRVIGNRVVQSEAAEPAIGEVQRRLFA